MSGMFRLKPPGHPKTAPIWSSSLKEHGIWTNYGSQMLAPFCFTSESHLPPAVRPFPLTWLWRIVSPGRSPPGCSKKWFQRLATAGLAAWAQPATHRKKNGCRSRAMPRLWLGWKRIRSSVQSMRKRSWRSTQIISNPRGVVGHGSKIHPKLVILNSKTKGLRVTQFSAQTCSCLTNQGKPDGQQISAFNTLCFSRETHGFWWVWVSLIFGTCQCWHPKKLHTICRPCWVPLKNCGTPKSPEPRRAMRKALQRNDLRNVGVEVLGGFKM